MCQVLWSLGYLSLWPPQLLVSPASWKAILWGGSGQGLAGTGCGNVKDMFAAGCLGS